MKTGPLPEAAPAPVLSEAEFRFLRDRIKAYAGICFGDETAFLLQRRLRPRLAALGLAGFSEYCAYLQDPQRSPAQRAQEMEEVFDLCSTRETYFFRQPRQLRAFRQQVLPLLRPAGPELRVWCAGCSTGEEAYSVAMEVLESGRFRGAPAQIQIVASDLSRAALETAQAGIYGRSAFRQTEAVARYRRYFLELDVPGPARRWQVLPEVRQPVHFLHHNLLEDLSHRARPFHVIFCRNVLIYFDAPARAALVDRLADCLVEGGYLLLGHSESLLRTPSPFELCHLEQELVYRKR